ncbi:MAG: outer membrane protein transport protein [Vicinamibacteria bacterium]
MSRPSRAALFLLAACAASAAPLLAQEPAPEAGLPSLIFNFAPPGARSLAMGASFVGLADDATASEANPAGLTVLTRPEVSGHLRTSSFDNTLPDTVLGSGFQTFDESATSPSFFSVVYPWKSAAVSGYYQRAANYRQDATFEGRYRVPEFFNILVNEVNATYTQLEVENVGVSLAYKVSPQVSVGASVRRTQMLLYAEENVDFTYPEIAGLRNSLAAAVDDTQTKVTFNAGVLFSPDPKLSLGAVYKRGADFGFAASVSSLCTPGPCGPDAPGGQVPVTLSVPHSFGAGAAFRPTERFTIAADVMRITYSDLSAAGSLAAEFGEGGGESIEDATEFHLGAEYALPLGSKVVALRAGFYTDPDHDGLAGVDSGQVHLTFGGGVVLGNRVQIDAAANLADTVSEGLLSFVVRF